MANVELQLLSNVIRDGDLSGIRKMGFNAAMLQTEEGKEIFRWIMDSFSDPKKPGAVPSLERVQRRFPDFDFCPTRDPIEALANEIIDNNVSAGIRETMSEIDALLDEGEEPKVILGAYLPQLRELGMQGSDGRYLMLSSAASMLREEYEQMRRAGGITGIPWPWAPLNQSTAGMQNEDFIVIYARPKQMKTWIALAICAYAYQMGYRVLVYSKEMSSKIMARRLASIICRVDYEQVKTGTLSEDDEDRFFSTLEALGAWEKENARTGRKAAVSFISDRDLRHGSAGVTVEILSAEAERFGAELILVDGFYLMRDGRTGVKSRDWKQVGNISSDIKEMAQRLAVPVIGTTQANRGASKTTGDDVDEIGYADAIGQDADLTMRVFKSKNLATGKPKLMITFPGTRDSVMNPFVVNAWPGKDFTLLQNTVDVEAFLHDKKSSDEEEAGRSGTSTGDEKDTKGGAGASRFKRNGPRQKVSSRIKE